MRSWLTWVFLVTASGSASATPLRCLDPSAPYTNFQAVFVTSHGVTGVVLSTPPDVDEPSHDLVGECAAGPRPGSLRCPGVFNPYGEGYDVGLDGDVAYVSQDGRDLALLLCE